MQYKTFYSFSGLNIFFWVEASQNSANEHGCFNNNDPSKL